VVIPNVFDQSAAKDIGLSESNGRTAKMEHKHQTLSGHNKTKHTALHEFKA